MGTSVAVDGLGGTREEWKKGGGDGRVYSHGRARRDYDTVRGAFT